MRGNVYKITIKVGDGDWDKYHLLVLDIVDAVMYRSCWTAAKCKILETGGDYMIYTDVLQREGTLV